MYMKGLGIPSNYPLALKWFRSAAEQGDEEAMTCLGLMYWKGAGVSQDNTVANMWFILAAEGSNPKKTILAKQALSSLSSRLSAEQLAGSRRMAEGCRKMNYKNCSE